MNFSFDWFKKVKHSGADIAATLLDTPKEEAQAVESTDSTFKVPYTKILDIQNHPGADRLEIATVYGFQVIVPKDRYKVGDKIIYIPIDSLLSYTLETKLFPPDAKIKLHKSRVRQIRIRKLASQGMIVDPSEVSFLVNMDYIKDEQDMKLILGVSKYEPPETGPAHTLGKPGGRKAQQNPNFHSYNGIGNLKWYPTLFKEGVDQVVFQEKVHGTNFRAAILPFVANTLWRKFLRFIGHAPAYINCYGSNRVDISAKLGYKGYYGEDLYGAIAVKYDVYSKLKPNETVFGEIIGPGIQKNYEYGLKEHKMLIFDVKVLQPDGSQVWMSPDEVEAYAKERGFDVVPILYKGPYNVALSQEFSKGPSVYDPKSTPVREGIVIKAKENYSTEGNKKALKLINEVYLDDKNNSDFH